MNSTHQYVLEFKRVLKENRLDENLYPLDFMVIWEETVESFVEGYSLSVFDADYDLMIRADIEVLLNADSLKEYEAFKYFTDKIEALDEKYKSVTFDISGH